MAVCARWTPKLTLMLLILLSLLLLDGHGESLSCCGGRHGGGRGRRGSVYDDELANTRGNIVRKKREVSAGGGRIVPGGKLAIVDDGVGTVLDNAVRTKRDISVDDNGESMICCRGPRGGVPGKNGVVKTRANVVRKKRDISVDDNGRSLSCCGGKRGGITGEKVASVDYGVANTRDNAARRKRDASVDSPPAIVENPNK